MQAIDSWTSSSPVVGGPKINICYICSGAGGGLAPVDAHSLVAGSSAESHQRSKLVDSVGFPGESLCLSGLPGLPPTHPQGSLIPI